MGLSVDWHILALWECRIFRVMEKSAQSQPRLQHRGKRKRKNVKAAFSVPAEFFRLIATMDSVNIQGNYDISTVVSPLLLLCRVCSVQCVCVLLCWCVLVVVFSHSRLKQWCCRLFLHAHAELLFIHSVKGLLLSHNVTFQLKLRLLVTNEGLWM